MSFLVYLVGGALLGALMRWWRPRPGWRWITAYWLAAGAFFAAPLLTSKLQVPSDIAYQWRPWREMGPLPVVPANGLLSDIPLQVIPFRALVRDRLLRGEAPLWAGEMGTGEPLLGNAQSAPFSPLGLLALPLPAVRALPVMAALKLFVSLLLTDALLAALGAGRAGACFAAIAFACSVYSICWALYPLGMAAAWLPGVVLGLVLLRRGERGDLAFEIGAHALQRLDVAAQALDLLELQLDLFLVGANQGVGLAQFAGRLVGARFLLVGLGGKLGDPRRQRVALGQGGLQLRGEICGIGAQLLAGALFQRQQVAQLADLLLQLLQRLVAPRQRVGQQELPGGEHQQHKDDDHQQLRQGVDKAGPDVDAGAPRAAAG